MKVKIREVKSIITKSKLPDSDYAVNPYVGCPHKCRYCYACFMKRFTGHQETWGDFIDIKEAPPIKNPHLYDGKKIFLGSVTDVYNPYEKKYGKTRELLEQLKGIDADITISTKSALVTRDVELLKEYRKLTVAFSINTADEEFRRDMDQASTITERIEAMKILYEEGIRTVVFISPIFPEITDVMAIVERTRDYCHEYWLENLNLRGGYKADILDYIEKEYPQHADLYHEIYTKGNKTYWADLGRELEQQAEEKKLQMKNYFYHEKIRKS